MNVGSSREVVTRLSSASQAQQGYVMVKSPYINEGAIHMKGLKRMSSFAGVLLSTSLAAQAAETTYAFTSVTGIQYGSPTSITGTLANTDAPTTVTIGTSLPDQCWKFLFSMMSTPGTYSVTVVTDTEANPWPTTTLTSCRLDRST